MATDEDYLDSLLKAATNPNQEGGEPSGKDNIYNSLFMDEQQLAEIDELLGLTNDTDGDSASDNGNDDDDSAFEQLLNMEPIATEEEPVSLDIESFIAEEEPASLNEEQVMAEEEPVSLDTEPFTAEEESVSLDIEPFTAEEESVSLDTEPFTAEEESVSPDAEPFTAEEESVSLDTEPFMAEEEPAVLDTELFLEEGSVAENEYVEELPSDAGMDMGQQIENAMMDNSLSEEMEIDLNSVEDLDALLGIKDKSSKRKEDNKSALNSEDEDLGDLLDGLGDDEELAEINELLKKSQNNEFVDEDDDMLALLEGTEAGEGVAETEKESADEGENSEGKEEEPKKKKWGRKKKAAETDESQPEGADSENKKAGGGFFGRLFAALTEEEEEPEDITLLNVEGTGEEGAQQEGEQQQEAEQLPAKKKGKKAKKKKGKKGAETNEEILEEMDAEDAAAKKEKKKKPKKEKKPKREKLDVIEEKGKKIPRKMIIRIFVLCFSIMIVIVIPALLLPQLLQKNAARNDFYKGNYQAAYEGLIGYDLNDSDAIILRKSELLSQLDRKATSSEAYRLAGENEKALNALLEGVAYYQDNLLEITDLGIQDDASAAYGKLLVLLQNGYSLGEEQILEIIALDKVAYTYRIKELAGGSVTSQQGAEEALPAGDGSGQDGNEAGNDESLQPSETPGENPAGEDAVMPEPLEDQLEEETE